MSLTQKNVLERLADAFGTNLEEMIADARPKGYGDGKRFFDLGVAAALNLKKAVEAWYRPILGGIFASRL